MLRGLTTVTYFAADHDAAKRWYTELLGVEPYFDRPGYAEFRIGDYQHELGLIDSSYAPHDTTGDPSGVVLYWHVDDVVAAFARLTDLGATEHEGSASGGPASSPPRSSTRSATSSESCRTRTTSTYWRLADVHGAVPPVSHSR